MEEMVGNADTLDPYQESIQKLWLGCGALSLLLVLGLAALLILGLGYDRQSARYPGALIISSHSNYSGLPFQYRWDNAYRTTASFPAVFNWYSIRYDLGAENRAFGDCALLEGSRRQLAVRRHISVSVCENRSERMIFVTRITSLR